MKKISFVYIILAGILWGTSCIFVNNLALYEMNSIHISCIRGTIASLTMIIYVLLYDRKLFKVSIKELMLYFGGGIGMFFTSACYYASMQMTSVSTAVVLMYTAPVFVMIYSVLFFGEKLKKLKAVSILAMIIGCGLVSGIIGGFKFDFFGIVLGFCAGIAYSTYNIFTKIQMREKCHPITASMYCFIFMAIISLFVAKPTEIVDVAMKSPRSILWMISCGVCTSVLPYFLYTVALKNIPVGTASALAIVEPMSATVFGMVLYSQMPDIYSGCGIVLILSAVFMLSRVKE
ncbi:MAG: hypothetical protein E7415_00245 [Ruminococcaceae bacterium]|nr:hypothetical protein [Oscillospiraceae bacterium]